MPNSARPSFVAVDWGTSSFRAALIAADGQVLDELSQPRGITSFKQHEFEPFLLNACAGLSQSGAQMFILSGMIGSRDGMLEVPYCPCAALRDDIARGVRWASGNRIAIVPGVRLGEDDVMRGEETQILGAASILGAHDALMVLPGTHSKWVSWEQDAIVGFKTFMTGELYAVLAQHSLLAKSLPPTAAALDTQAFLQGLDTAREGASLLHTVFGVRVKRLFQKLSPEQAASYLSGLLIGDELASMPLKPAAQVVLIGSHHLTQRYQLAFEHLGVRPTILGSDAAWAGLHQIYQALVN